MAPDENSASAAQLSSDELLRLRQTEFRDVVAAPYLNHASFGPVSQAYVTAAESGLRELSRGALGDVTAVVYAKSWTVREHAAGVLGCSPHDLAILHSTSEGLGLIAQGLDWQSGDEVVTYELEHPNTVYPWKNLASRGVTTRFIPDRGCRFLASDLEAAITSRTRAVSLSLVNFAHGFRMPLEDIATLCNSRGIWLAVDGVQAAGALDLKLATSGADVVAAHCYKWLLGGLGLSLCYCSARAKSELRVPTPGWFGRTDPTDVRVLSDFELEFAADARRFEASEPSYAELSGLEAGLAMLGAVGMGAVERQIKSLTDRVAAGLSDSGYQVVSPRDGSSWSGIVSAEPPTDVTTDSIAASLQRASISASIRQGRLRVSPHFYNTAAEIDLLLEALPR